LINSADEGTTILLFLNKIEPKTEIESLVFLMPNFIPENNFFSKNVKLLTFKAVILNFSYL